MGAIKEHALRELRIIGYDDKALEDEVNKGMFDSIMTLVDTFESQGHSGISAEYAVRIFNKLASFQALSPITKSSDEWKDVSAENSGKPLWQNNRDPRFFSEDGGETWYSLDEKQPTTNNTKEEDNTNNDSDAVEETEESSKKADDKKEEAPSTKTEESSDDSGEEKKEETNEENENEPKTKGQSGEPTSDDSNISDGNKE